VGQIKKRCKQYIEEKDKQNIGLTKTMNGKEA